MLGPGNGTIYHLLHVENKSLTNVQSYYPSQRGQYRGYSTYLSVCVCLSVYHKIAVNFNYLEI